ncbi:hypothetical protein [Azospirillum isscasi]|uniref:Haloacid dehalogenase-like hydrolase n=1 Tax=Azospirillum isscasi TaxID=3053926 RepID=A0ABU0WPT4_9PROT|nr:hypothetical protein [Azospirillum isscasi]MDQ2105847.1 hypothetical protein [Azospirillum isscasi]
MTPAGFHIGIDFDNTIVLYDAVFAAVGRAMGLLPDGFAGNKAQVRATVRARPGGEAEWTRLQARVYGPGIRDAAPSPGLCGFLDRCRRAGARVGVVSHKTAFAAADPGGVNLREAAWAWLADHGLIGPDGIDPANVHFESTRAEKIRRIRAIGCTHFIDDLDEVFLEPDFPSHVRRYLFAPGSAPLPAGPFTACPGWVEIGDDLFGARSIS